MLNTTLLVGFGPLTQLERGEAEAEVEAITAEAEHRTATTDVFREFARRPGTRPDLSAQDLDGMTIEFTG